MTAYPQYAGKNGVTIIDEGTFNGLLALQDFRLIYAGAAVDSYTASAATEFDNASYHWAQAFTATGVTTLGWLYFSCVKHGTGADMVVELRETTGSYNSIGPVLKRVTIPKEWIPSSKTGLVVPFAVSGLVAGQQYKIIIKKAGDATNHFHLYGSSVSDASHPCWYDADDAGAWTAATATLYFWAQTGDTGLLYGIEDGNGAIATFSYSSGKINQINLYIPAVDGTSGIRQVETLTYAGNNLTRGVVT